MKFLVNSEYFHHRIYDAIRNQASSFKADGGEIKFIGTNNTIDVQIHPLDKQDESDIFDPARWKTVADFLKQIPEQPITVKLYYNSINIFCEADFKLKTEEL